MMDPHVESKPPHRLPHMEKHIYEGKFVDREPCIRSAGKLTFTGEDTTEKCLKPDPRPESPEVIKRFRATFLPDYGTQRVHYGKANDPHRQWAKDMIHGLSTEPSHTAGEVLNPFPPSLFKHRIHNKKESIYHTRVNRPLGSAPDPFQRDRLPKHMVPIEKQTFGMIQMKDGNAGELINPGKTYEEVAIESEIGRDLYRRSHKDFKNGEQLNREYKGQLYSKFNQFGIPTPHDNTGLLMRKTMKWLTDEKAERMAPIISKRLDDFRERTQPQLGMVHDPIKDTLNVPPDHTFGILIKPDEYGVGDLLHGRAPRDYLRGKDRLRGVVAAMRQHLKKCNYQNFDDLLSAFKHYDKSGCGRITMDDLREICIQFNLPADTELLEQLMDVCDVNGDGCIDYVEFCNFLNWKNKLPSGTPGSECNKNPVLSHNFADNPDAIKRLDCHIDKAIHDHRTSASMINAVVGGVSNKGYRKYGVPSIRSDKAAPKIRRVCDTTNYGDESNAFGLVNPSIFSNKGLNERDFLKPRPRHEIYSIFCNIGVKMSQETFDQLYCMAARMNSQGLVSVESFRTVLDETVGRRVLGPDAY